MRISAEQAQQSGKDGYWVLNGAADGPATRILQDRTGADVKAKSQDEAQKALAEAGHDYPVVELSEHEFPDASTGQPHRIKVWVPDIRR
jgi:hypothetical protein